MARSEPRSGRADQFYSANGPAAIAQFTPQDATTNPSLILAAVKDPKYAKLIKVAVDYAKEKGG